MRTQKVTLIMEKLPIIVFEKVLSYLNPLDKHNAIVAFNYDYTALPSHLNSKILLALEYRFREHALSYVIGSRQAFIKELDLTGIFWISEHTILETCLQLVNLECLYLLGTSVVIDKYSKLQGFHNVILLKKVNTTGNSNGNCILHRSCDSDQFNKNFVFDVSTYGKYPIVSENWLSLIKAGATVDNIAEEIRDSYTEVSYYDFMVEGEKLKELLHNLRNEKILLLRQKLLKIVERKMVCRNIRSVNIEPIKYLIHLTALYIDVHEPVGELFLKPILQSCESLKKLCITCYNAMFSFSHLKHASERLQELSVTMYSSEHFNISKFFFNINEHTPLRLRRLHLRLHTGIVADEHFDAQSALANFMRRNPQLIFVSIVFRDKTRKKVIDIARLLKTFQKKPHQSFTCMLDDIFQVGDVPLQHVDLLNVFLSPGIIYYPRCGNPRIKRQMILAQMRKMDLDNL